MFKRTMGLLTASLLIGSLETGAQVLTSIETSNTCSYFGEDVPSSVASFASTQEASAVIERIVRASGLAKNFDIRSAGVPNAAAVTQGGVRLVLYNPDFMSQTRQQTNSEWAAVSIMAHEIGHHLNGHTLDDTGSRPDRELEADYFSGFILQKMGATVSDAQVAMRTIGSDTGSQTHPAKNDRLTAISSGWYSACENDSGCNSAGGPTGGSRQPSETTTPPVVVPDISRPPISIPPQQMTPICQTPYMWCNIGTMGPVGTPCYCNSMYGPISGAMVAAN